MKQILFAALASVAVLTSSCSKDNGGDEPDPATHPISGLEMPVSSAENPIIAGTTVNIKGVGFTASDELWFSTTANSSDRMKAEGLKLTATGISFTAPAIDGETGVTLKQAGKAYLLGNIFFSTGNPITGLEMPVSSAENPIIAGTTVNIKGVGFTASDELWFSTTANSSDRMKAEGLKLTATGISFTAPAIDGETGVTLKQAGKAYLLGNIFFSTGDKPSKTEHLYATTGDKLLEYNFADGTFKSVFQSQRPMSMGFPIADDRSNIYYTDFFNNELTRYNLIEKKEVRLIPMLHPNDASIGIIDDKLHLMRWDLTNGFRLMLVADDGKETLVKAFGPLPDAGYAFADYLDHRFVYDAASESVIITGTSAKPYDDDNLHTKSSLLSFSLQTGVITTKHQPYVVSSDSKYLTATWFNAVKTDAGVLLFTITNRWKRPMLDDTGVGETVITYIDPTTLTQKSDVATIPYAFDRLAYMVSENMLMGIDMADDGAHVAWSYDLTTKNLEKVNSTENFGCFFTMSY